MMNLEFDLIFHLRNNIARLFSVKAHSHRGRQRTSPRRASMLCTDLGENAQASLHVFDFQHRRASMLFKEHRCSVGYRASMLCDDRGENGPSD